MSPEPRGRRILIGTTVDYQLQYHDGLPELLVQHGWEVHVVATAGTNAKRFSNMNGVTAHSVSMGRTPNPLRDLLALRQWISIMHRIRPSVTLVGTPKASLLGGLAAWSLRVPNRIYELHGLRLESSKGVSRSALFVLEWLTSRLATRTLAVGKSLAQRAVEYGVSKESKTVVLGWGSPNGVDLSRFTKRPKNIEQAAMLGLRGDRPTLGFVGRLNKAKGLHELAEALTSLKSKNYQVEVLIIGGLEGEDGDECLRLLHASGQHVTFVGEVSNVEEYYPLMDVLCLPSHREGLPTVVLEAFACEVPVIGSDATGIVDLIQDGFSGLVVRRGDSQALEEAITQLAASKSIRTELSENAKTIVRERYERATVQARLVDYLNGLAIDPAAEAT